MSSIFAKLVELIQEVHKPQGKINTEPFLNVCRQLIVVIDKFGTGFSLVRSDVNGNIDRLEAARSKNPDKYEELFQIILAEVASGLEKEKYSDSRGLLWLKSTAVSESYHETLYRYHTWYTAAAFTIALKLVPTREAFFEKLGATGEEAMEELNQFTVVWNTVLAEIEDFLKAHNLDDPTPV